MEAISAEKKIHTHLCYPSFIEKNRTVLFSGIGGNGDNYCGGRSNCRSAFKDAQFKKKLIVEIILKIDISKWYIFYNV